MRGLCFGKIQSRCGLIRVQRSTFNVQIWDLVNICPKMGIRRRSEARDAFVFSPLGRFKEPPFRFDFALILPTRRSHWQFKLSSSKETAMKPHGMTAISPLQAGPPVASSPQDTHPSSSIEKRHALLPICCADPSIQ